MPEENPPSERTTRSSGTPRARGAAKPRAGIQRKTQAEREEYARKEAERAKEREAKDTETAGNSAKVTSTRGGRAGARAGRAVVNKSDRTSAPVTSGVFGAGTGHKLGEKKPLDLGVSEALDGEASLTAIEAKAAGDQPSNTASAESPNAKRSTAKTAKDKAVKGQSILEETNLIEQDEDAEDLPRRDIERIWISSDEDEDAIVSYKGKQKSKSRGERNFGGLRPVRAPHTVANVPLDMKGATMPEKSSTGEINMLEVDSDDIQVVDASAAVKKDPPSSPETSRKSLKKLDSRSKEPKEIIETVEERAEKLRLRGDIHNLRDAFVSHKPSKKEHLESRGTESVFSRTGQDTMFLFQLPPLVPQLLHPDQPAVDLLSRDAMDIDQAEIKVEDAAAAESTRKGAEGDKSLPQPKPMVYTADSDIESRLPEGLVGKLRIHKSGKVSLDWGGTDMEVRYGTEVDFLQDVICVEEAPMEMDASGTNISGTGKVYAMGQIDRKMVLVPDWTRLYA